MHRKWHDPKQVGNVKQGQPDMPITKSSPTQDQTFWWLHIPNMIWNSLPNTGKAPLGERAIKIKHSSYQDKFWEEVKLAAEKENWEANS